MCLKMSVRKWLSTSAGKAKTCLSVFWQKCVHNCLLLYDYNCYYLLLLFMWLCVRARVPWRRHSWISQMTTLGCHFFLSAILAFRLPCRATGTLTWGATSQASGIGGQLSGVFVPFAFLPGLNENVCFSTWFVPTWCCQILEFLIHVWSCSI